MLHNDMLYTMLSHATFVRYCVINVVNIYIYSCDVLCYITHMIESFMDFTLYTNANT